MSTEAIDASYAVSEVEDLPQLWDGAVKLVRAGLGICAFGVNIMDLGTATAGSRSRDF
jgi:hypothetical protein